MRSFVDNLKERRFLFAVVISALNALIFVPQVGGMKGVLGGIVTAILAVSWVSGMLLNILVLGKDLFFLFLAMIKGGWTLGWKVGLVIGLIPGVNFFVAIFIGLFGFGIGWAIFAYGFFCFPIILMLLVNVNKKDKINVENTENA